MVFRKGRQEATTIMEGLSWSIFTTLLLLQTVNNKQNGGEKGETERGEGRKVFKL